MKETINTKDMSREDALNLIKRIYLPMEGPVLDALKILIPDLGRDDDDTTMESLICLVENFAHEENKARYRSWIERYGAEIGAERKRRAFVEGSLSVLRNPNKYGLVKADAVLENITEVKDGLIRLKDTIKGFKIMED